MATAATRTSSGVQDLVTRLRNDGVQAGELEAERIVADAQRKADALLTQARAEVELLRERAVKQLETDRESALQALKLAQRDTVLELRDNVVRHFKQHMKRLVSETTTDKELIRSLVLVLAGRAASEFIRGRDAEILVSAGLFNETPSNPDDLEQAKERARNLVLGITGEMLREGIELIPASNVTGGARIRAKGEDAEVDLSDAAVTELLYKHMLPRFRAILEGSE